jgi:pantoate kinase
VYISSIYRINSGFDQHLEHGLLKKARAFVPGHVTGIFRIHDEFDNPIFCGSTGAGFSVAAGIETTVYITENPHPKIVVEYNNNIIDGPVTRTVIRRLTEDYKQSFNVKVEHRSSIPSGVGFGASGAGSLGTAIAFGHLLDSTMSIEKAARYAHIAEVTNHTGLGDVSAQVVGGFEIRTHPGTIGIGKIQNFTHREQLNVVLAGNSGLETRHVIIDPEWRNRINEVGAQLVKRIIKNPTLKSFIECSQQFADATGLKSNKVKSALIDLGSNGFEKSSMVMLGDSVFCFCLSSETEDVLDILSKYWNHSDSIVTQVTENGGRLT